MQLLPRLIKNLLFKEGSEKNNNEAFNLDYISSFFSIKYASSHK